MDAIDMRCIQIALEISKKFKFQTMGYDFLYDASNNPLIGEMSYTYNAEILYHCPGYWDSNLKFHEGNYWPQYLQLIDALQLPDLKQPDITLEKPDALQQLNKYIGA